VLTGGGGRGFQARFILLKNVCPSLCNFQEEAIAPLPVIPSGAHVYYIIYIYNIEIVNSVLVFRPVVLYVHVYSALVTWYQFGL